MEGEEWENWLEDLCIGRETAFRAGRGRKEGVGTRRSEQRGFGPAS